MKKMFHMLIDEIGMVYYEKMLMKKDLGPLVMAEEKFKFIEKNYPNTDFALDSYHLFKTGFNNKIILHLKKCI